MQIRDDDDDDAIHRQGQYKCCSQLYFISNRGETRDRLNITFYKSRDSRGGGLLRATGFSDLGSRTSNIFSLA